MYSYRARKWLLVAHVAVASVLLSGCGDSAIKAFKAQPCGNTTIGGMLDTLAIDQDWQSEKLEAEGKKKETNSRRINLTAHFKFNGDAEELLMVVNGKPLEDGKTWEFFIRQMDVTTAKGTQHVTAEQPQYLATMYCQAQGDFATGSAGGKG